MLVTVVGGLIFSERRSLNQIFSKSLRKLWNEWELPVMVVLSLSLQIILILLGNRRKYIARRWIRATLWLAYNLADWIAIVSLGSLLNKDPSNPHYVIMAFWAPFLLVHLGGPDTITAYALEDNELWKRHSLNLLVQFSVAIYVLLRSWTRTSLNFLAIPMFVAGVVKNGERTWILRFASRDHLSDSMLPRPDPGPNYAKFMDEYSCKKSEGFIITVERVGVTPTLVDHPDGAPTVVDHPDRAPTVVDHPDRAPTVVDHPDGAPTVVDHPDGAPERNNVTASSDDAFILRRADYFFNTFKRLLADLILSFQDRENSMSFFQNISSNDAFRVIEVELGFMYDLLYTKAAIIQSGYGILLRFISLSCTCSVLVAFIIIDRNKYSGVDVVVTYVLLIGAILLEFYSLLMLLISSDWTEIWWNKHNSTDKKKKKKAFV